VTLSVDFKVAPGLLLMPLMYRVGQKTGLFLRSDNFAMTNDRKACDMSKISEFCLELE